MTTDAPLPPTPEAAVVAFCRDAEQLRGIVFAPEDYDLLESLLDQWSTRAVFTALDITESTRGDREFLPLFREKVGRVLQLLAQFALDVDFHALDSDEPAATE